MLECSVGVTEVNHMRLSPFLLFILSLHSLRFSEDVNYRGGVEGKQDSVWEEDNRKERGYQLGH